MLGRRLFGPARDLGDVAGEWEIEDSFSIIEANGEFSNDRENRSISHHRSTFILSPTGSECT